MTTRSKCWLISSLYTSRNSILQRGNSWIQFCQFISHCVCSTLDLVSEALLCWVYADWSAIDWLNSWNHIICQGDHRTPQIICAIELDLKTTIFPLHFKNGKYETFCNTDSQQHQQLFRYTGGLSSIHFGKEDMNRKGCIPLYITRQGSAGHIPVSEGLHTRFD